MFGLGVLYMPEYSPHPYADELHKALKCLAEKKTFKELVLRAKA